MVANGDRHNLRCAMDHILEAEKNGEISAENVIYIVENINVAGRNLCPADLRYSPSVFYDF